MRFSLLLLLCILLSCQRPTPPTQSRLAPLIIFGHNLHGELSSCGCRKKPLGGIVQLAGFISKLKKKYPHRKILYFDSGDALFPPGQIPKLLVKSHQYAAQELLSFLNQLGLSAFTPGDQDFSQGVNFLKGLLEKYSIPTLLSNGEVHSSQKDLLIYEANNIVTYFVGVLSPEVFSAGPPAALSLKPVEPVLEKLLSKIETQHGQNFPTKQKVIFLISHSGMQADKKIAQRFPQIQWIIGAHSQSFTQIPEKVGSTQIVQVLSRNHHIGFIDLLNLKQPFKSIELDDQFSDFSDKKKWTRQFQKVQEKLRQLKENEFSPHHPNLPAPSTPKFQEVFK